jgi:hypothetical protein
MQHRAFPAFGEAERRAWGIVLDAIEEALDVDGLQHFDRAKLSELHERAAWHIGVEQVVIPTTWAAQSDWEIMSAPGGVHHLADFGLDSGTLAVLAYGSRLLRIEDVERRTDADLLRIRRIGPKRLRAIREAIKRYHGHQQANVSS